VLLLSNGGSRRAKVRVTAAADDAALKATVTRKRMVLPAGQSAALKFTVTRSSEGSGQDSGVEFVVTSRPVARPAPDPQIVVAGLNVKAAASLAVIEAKIDSSVDTINENRPGSAALVVTNPRETSLDVGETTVTAPAGVDVRLTCPGGRASEIKPGTTSSVDCRVRVPPRSQAVIPLIFSTTDRVAPGPRSVLVKVAAAGGAQQQSVVASTSFTVDIFAEADILKSIGVPVFLLLPGVVIVLTAWFLIKHVSPWRGMIGDVSIGSAVSAATATAVLGLAVSLVVALVYPTLTGKFVPGYERDYLKAYGFRDFYYVIGYSFVVAVVVWIVASCAFLLARWLFLPWPHDEATDLLRKVGMRGLARRGTTFPRVNVDGNKGGLQLSTRPANKALVAPPISVVVESGNGDLAGKIEGHATDGHPLRLWYTVSVARLGNDAKMDYRTDGGHDIADPQVFDRDELQVNPSKNPIVVVKTGTDAGQG
jgi:hypothetical protein